VTESLASGLPLLWVDALPGQEVGNAEFVVANDAGAFCTKPAELQTTVTKWLANESAISKQKRKNAARVGKPEAAFKIVDSAWDLVQNSPKGQPIQRRLARTTRLKDLLTRFHINHTGD
jgi:UDP-N-acetylglucosamine:LPS N-acetylglucosamine transferase